MWYCNQDKVLEVRIERIKTRQKSELVPCRTCFAIQENEYREKKRISSITNQPLFIYTSSGTLESFLMLWCNIWISSHDLTHHQHNSLSISPCQITPRCNTSDHFLIITQYTTTILPHLLTFPPFGDTNFFLSTIQPITHNSGRNR